MNVKADRVFIFCQVIIFIYSLIFFNLILQASLADTHHS